MRASIRVISTFFVGAFLLSTAAANTDLPLGAKCRQEIRAVDDQTDTDVRRVNELIVVLEGEIADSAIASSGPDLQNSIRARLEAAKTRRSDIIEKQHTDLNAIRARCDRLRDEQQRAGTADPSAPS